QTAGRGVSGRPQMIRAVPSRIATETTTQARNKTAGFGRVEDFAITLTLSAMMLLPLAEIVLRRTLHTSIGASIIVQHLAFIAGMLGGAIAAREGRMLALSTLGESLLGGRLQAAARILSGAVGGTGSAFLAAASYEFVEAERPFSKVLAYGIPVWVIE